MSFFIQYLTIVLHVIHSNITHKRNMVIDHKLAMSYNFAEGKLFGF